MSETAEAKKIVANAVAEVLDREMAHVREALVQQVMASLPAGLDGSAAVSDTANLVKAVSAIHGGTTQREILRALLDNSVRYCGRTALFVVKNGAASGWQSRGFSSGEEDPVKDFPLELRNGVAERALQSRTPFSGHSKDMDSEFCSRFGAASAEVLVLPLVLKEKVAALLYADGGTDKGNSIDSAALELLVMSTSAWLEVTSLRKQSGDIHEAGANERPEPVPVAKAAAAVSDPFAAHAPSSVVRPAAPVVSPATVEEQPSPADPVESASAEDADMHRKAQRFARLLVDEIKLYNQAKVADGRKHKDLYDRLKDDIDKSRATYHKRYGNTAAGSADYFNQELVRSLAEDDSSVMGANFRR